MTNILLLPIITVQAITAQDGDIDLSVGILNSDNTAVDLTGITFGMQWRKQAGDTSVLFDPGSEGYLVNGGTSGVISIAAPQTRAGRIPAGTYVADLVAQAVGKTVVVGQWSITHSAMGICRVAAIGTLQRNAATAGIVGYVPGPPGKSAYQVALDDGFVGTESAWLASLVGDVTPAALAARDAAATSASGAAASKSASDTNAAQTAADRSAVHTDRTAADADAQATAADRQQTGLDRQQTTSDRQATASLLASFCAVFLGAFQTDAAADAFAVANSVTKSAGISYENTTSAKVRVWSGTTWADQDADAQTQSANAGLSAAAAANSATAAANSATGAATSKTAADADAQATAADRTAVHTDKLAADASATAAATTKQLIDAAIASFNAMGALPALPYLLDGLPPAAVLSAPKGAFALNGSYVSLSSLLTFSTAQKYTVGPDGNYILNAANAPAWDWSTGRKRLLIEAIAATNICTFSSDFSNSAWSKSGVIIATGVADPKGGTDAQTITAEASGASIYKGVPAVGGNTYTNSLWVRRRSGVGVVSFYRPDTGSSVNLALTSSWQRFSVTGAAYGSGAGGSAYLELIFQTAGDQIDVFNGQTETGSVPSSDIVSGSSPTTRAADVVTAASGLLALLNSGTASLVWRGQLLAGGGAYPDDGILLGSGSNSSRYIATTGMSNKQWGPTYLSTGGGNYIVVPNGGSPASLVGGFACAYSPNGLKGSLNGGGVVSAVAPGFDASDTSLAIGTALSGTGRSNLLLDELVVWPFVGSDAGIQAQAGVYQ